MTENTDRNLVDAHLRGEPEAFETLLGRYGPSVLGYLTKMTHNRDQAEDIFQETFQRVHTHADQFQGENLKPWIFKIATHAAINEFRKAPKAAVISLDQPAGCADGHNCPAPAATLAAATDEPVEQLQRDEKRQMVRQSLAKLPEKQRIALILNYYQKMTYKEIAESMGCSVGAVKTHLFRALKRLATLLPQPVGEP